MVDVFCKNRETFLNLNLKKNYSKTLLFTFLKKNITFQVTKSDYETQKKNCYQQPIFELMNKKMQLLSSFNFGIWRHSRLVTRPL